MKTCSKLQIQSILVMFIIRQETMNSTRIISLAFFLKVLSLEFSVVGSVLEGNGEYVNRIEKTL